MGKDLGLGMLYAILLDLTGLVMLWLVSSWELGPWALILLWIMVALAITGISIAEQRWLLPVGFWAVQLGVFTLWLVGYFQLVRLLNQLGT